ncbi:Serine protease/ABC transporter B family protein tagC [Madurella mycetomatis]|uniref:Serine protease/ABC transporter B family protein tagC n=1 Tax=Madurella mycetomatis TaxID=100816 RepID=A0A175VVL7_9PEZI|nr:Serine protease/ABC transporter B family protein tagC [Madurella mycetomatis]
MPLLNGNSFTLASLEPEHDDFQSLPDQEKPNRVLIETKVPASRELKKRLSEVHLEPERNLGDNTWLCKPSGDTGVGIDLDLVKRLDLINIARTVPLSLKIQPSLKAGDETATHVVDIVLYGSESEDSIHELSRRISEAVGVSVESMRFRRENSIIRLKTPQSSLSIIAQDPRVSAIEQVHELELHNNVARGVIHADVLINDTPFKGKGQIITVADSGFDKGSTADTHPAFTGRVRDLFAVGREKTGKTDDAHVCGSALGDGSSATMGGTIQGTAPEAELIVQSLLDENKKLFGSSSSILAKLLDKAYQQGSRVHTNSWGPKWDEATGQVPYNNASTELDEFVWTHPDMVVCFSAGNDGDKQTQPGHGHIGGQAAAKNCITVGSCDNHRLAKDNKCTAFDAAGTTQGNPANVSWFSSRGPTWENRVKPDVVAPGSMVLSTKTRAPGVNVKENYGKSTDPLWYFNTGTSMATPLVAGCAAVLRQTLIGSGLTNPSAALIRAMLINGAIDLGKSREEQGFGRVDLASSVIVNGKTKNRDFIEGELIEEDDKDEVAHKFKLGQYMTDAAKTGTLKTTLVWTDVPGSVLQHEIGLRVTVEREDKGTKIETKSGNLKGPDGNKAVNSVGQLVWKDLSRDDKVALVVKLDGMLLSRAKSQPFALVWSVTEQQN